MSMEPDTPATEVKKHPTNPTKMMVLVEGMFSELAIMQIYL
jgi:hypothetical protein